MADNSTRTPGVGEDIRTVQKGGGSGPKTDVVILDLGGSGTEKLSSFPASDEDVAHVGGETLIRTGAKRTTAPAGSAGTDGDWSTFNNDDDGLLWARVPPHGRTTWYDLVTQASAVAALDQLCDEQELTSMSLVAGRSGQLDNAVLFSNNLTIISAALWLYQVNPTAAGTNAVHDQSDANNESSRPFGAIYFTNWQTSTSNMFSIGTYAGQPLGACPLKYQCLDGTLTTSVWGILVTYTAVTPGATTDYNLMLTHTAGV